MGRSSRRARIRASQPQPEGEFTIRLSRPKKMAVVSSGVSVDWAAIRETYPVGSVRPGTITRLFKDYARVDVGEGGILGRLSLEGIVDRSLLKRGAVVTVRVHSIDQRRGWIHVSWVSQRCE